MMLPATAVAGPLFTIDTSAEELTVVITVELLLAGFESALDVDAVAVLLTIVPFVTVGAACTVTVNCALPAFGSSAIVQATLPLVFGAGVLQAAAGPVSCTSEMKLMPAGGVSLDEGSSAASGPPFVRGMM